MAIAPAIMVSSVTQMGCIQVLPAVTTASTTLTPRWASFLAKSTSRMELRTSMPARARLVQPATEGFLHHHRGVVHQYPDGKDQGEQARPVDGVTRIEQVVC